LALLAKDREPLPFILCGLPTNLESIRACISQSGSPLPRRPDVTLEENVGVLAPRRHVGRVTPVQGRVMLAGIGDPAAEDARFIGIDHGRLGLWLGSGQSGMGNHNFQSLVILSVRWALLPTHENENAPLSAVILSGVWSAKRSKLSRRICIWGRLADMIFDGARLGALSALNAVEGPAFNLASIRKIQTNHSHP
jgi:hypothetical protein